MEPCCTREEFERNELIGKIMLFAYPCFVLGGLGMLEYQDRKVERHNAEVQENQRRVELEERKSIEVGHLSSIMAMSKIISDYYPNFTKTNNINSSPESSGETSKAIINLLNCYQDVLLIDDPKTGEPLIFSRYPGSELLNYKSTGVEVTNHGITLNMLKIKFSDEILSLRNKFLDDYQENPTLQDGKLVFYVSRTISNLEVMHEEIRESSHVSRKLQDMIVEVLADLNSLNDVLGNY